MEIIKKAVKVGNSAGVLLPKKLLGAEVKITIINRPIDIKKEALKLISPFLQDIIGIYILNKNPIEILAISSTLKKIINKDKIKISIIPLEIIKKDIRKEPLKKKLDASEIIFNPLLLKELKQGYN